MYLLDTNILIYHFNENIPESSSRDINSMLKNHFNISVITKIEFLGYRGHTSKSFKAAKSFLDEARVYYLEEESYYGKKNGNNVSRVFTKSSSPECR